jgi:hypothetical protein
MGTRWLRFAVGAVLALLFAEPAGAGAVQAPPPAPAPVVVPAALQALEQKTAALQVTSERFSATIAVAAKPVVKGSAGLGPLFGRSSRVRAAVARATRAEPRSAGSGERTETLITLTGEAAQSPPQASVQISFLGLHFEARLLGTTLYTKAPFLTQQDGGRAWVEEPDKTLQGTTGLLGAATPGAASGSADSSSFGGLIAALNGARSIVATGPSSVDGQVTTGFKATTELSRLATLPAKQRRLLHKLLAPRVSLEVLFAEDGLPVRTRVVLSLTHHQGQLIAQSDVLAINIPVSVQAPPASETITRAQLERIERRKLRRLRHLRRKIVAVHRKRGAGAGKSK